RVEKLTADHICSRGQLRKIRRIEFENIAILLPILDNKAGGDAVALCADNLPRTIGFGRCHVAGATLEFSYRHPLAPMPVRVPVAVGNFAESVDVIGGNGTLFPHVLCVSRRYKPVIHEVVEIINLSGRQHSRCTRFRFSPQRIVRIEFLRDSTDGLSLSQKCETRGEQKYECYPARV